MSRLKIHLTYAFGAVLTACVIVAFYPVRQGGVPQGERHGSPVASFEKQAANLDPGKSGAAPLDLGEMGLGSIRELVLTLESGSVPNGFERVESSCSCLQPLTQPTLFSVGNPQHVRARYLAVRSGPIDVTLAFSRRNPEGKEEILTARVTGKVAEGDESLSTQLTEMVKTPLPARPASDPVGVVSAAEARPEVESGRGLVIDIRAKEDFSRSHIEGALNIPPTQLKPGGAFRGRDLYLAGPPVPTLALLEARRGLLRQGAAKVFVIRDGAPGWKASGGRVFEQMDPPPAVSGVSLRELLELSDDQRVAVIGAGIADDFAFRYFLPGGETVELLSLKDAVERKLRANADARVLIVDEKGDRFGELNQSAPAHWLGRVSYLRAGFSAYRAAREELALLASRGAGETGGSVSGFAKREPGQRVGVPVPSGSPGCGTCPKR